MHTQLKTFNLKKKNVQFPERKTSPDNKIHQRELFQTKHEKKKKKNYQLNLQLPRSIN